MDLLAQKRTPQQLPRCREVTERGRVVKIVSVRAGRIQAAQVFQDRHCLVFGDIQRIDLPFVEGLQKHFPGCLFPNHPACRPHTLLANLVRLFFRLICLVTIHNSRPTPLVPTERIPRPPRLPHV